MLTSFNGQTITYDEIGNPLQYRDGMSFTWVKGRQLQGITKDGLNAGYTYDENGLRISKTVNGITTKIFRTNGQMVGMNSSDGKDVTFILDGDGKVYGIHYDHYSANELRPETYYFAFNAQGDVIGIYDFGGRLMATYDYDEWGNCTVNVLAADSNGHAIDSPDHVAYVNPFRYRGYFYDAETGFYYLNSRYYDPGTGRFVNADGLVQTGQGMLDKNMFAYCLNNPIICRDPNGCACEYTITIPAEGNAPATMPDGSLVTPSPNSNGTYTYTVSPPASSTQLVIAQTILGEAGGSSEHKDWKDGQRAVATIIFNRVNSSNYPDDFAKVCKQKSQFHGYSLGKERYESGNYNAIMWDNAMLLAEEMLSGNFTPHPDMNSDYLYFYAEKGRDKDKIERIKGQPGVVIAGGNIFYTTWT